MANATSESFYLLDRAGNQYLSDQWGPLVDSIKSLRTFFESRFIAPNSSDPDAILSGLALGDSSGRFKWRTYGDNSEWYLQYNQGTDSSQDWVTRLGVGAASGIDFLSLINFNRDQFYLSTAKSSPPEPVVNIRKSYIDQDGSISMDADLKLDDDGIHFKDDTDTGFVRESDSTIVFDINNVDTLKISPQGTGHRSGSESAPGVYFNSDVDTGVYRSGADEISLAAGATQRARFGSTISFAGNTSITGDVQVTGRVSASSRLMASSFYVTPTAHSMTNAIEAIPTYGDGAGQKFQSYKLDLHPDHFYISETSGDYPQINLTTGQATVSVNGIVTENPYFLVYRSAPQQLTTSGAANLTFTHGLGAAPDHVELWARAHTADGNFPVGTEIRADISIEGATGIVPSFNVARTATTVVVSQFTSASFLRVVDIGDFTETILDETKWVLSVTAIRYK